MYILEKKYYNESMKPAENAGIELKGNVGITSHFGDILRNATIPSKLTPVTTSEEVPA
jgi:hypothetical protein